MAFTSSSQTRARRTLKKEGADTEEDIPGGQGKAHRAEKAKGGYALGKYPGLKGFF